MSYVIFGRAIKTEYLSVGTLVATGLLTYCSLGGKKDASAAGKTISQRVNEAAPIKAASKEEEELFDSIKHFISEAEKDGGGSSHH
ncbi:hypothetical protein BKA82DRAFT_1000145 [Pisolithus tinctorius]|uniref:Uncharacterized protein n=1 Tax=Pisolithus tinctorius Marx 270 TaxID=870435 RepID=A0A0C3NW30_PISTI|nr:hypothetical protein BKA82DRAFT_1000145 [Pisolithus tinctorius]KIO05085.1 hypothetical protein M404DRAFT_1000145 [Pisolithus tinctorius Marx 270]